MGREIKKVALNFTWPLHKVWKGFINPYYKFSHQCKVCDGTGYSPRAKELRDLWYGYVEFNPEMTGSKPFTIDHPHIKELATKNAFFNEFGHGTDIDNYWKFYNENKGRLIPSLSSIEQEARRLCNQCYNNHWSHHLSQEDADALWKAGRLAHYFKEKPTAQQVNNWSLSTMGHDSCNQYICIEAKCKREKVKLSCGHCKGYGSVWESKEYKKKADKWKQKEPPSGPGFQIWETVSEGSPVSPVFEKPEDLARWMVANDTSVTKGTTFQQWCKFITKTQWAPSGVVIDGVVKSGVQL